MTGIAEKYGFDVAEYTKHDSNKNSLANQVFGEKKEEPKKVTSHELKVGAESFY